ncbi:MAG: restriction endonuclease subunit S [Oscillospiraceae bacterium]
MARLMKNSGIQWIGDIPQDWKIEKGKYHFTNNKYIPGAYSYKYDRLALTLKGVINRSKDDTDGLQPKDFNNYQLLKKGQLVFKLIDLQNVSTSRVGLAHTTGLVSSAYIVLHANEDICPKYAEKFYLMMWYREIFNALGDNGVRSNIGVTDLLNTFISIPSIKEQQRIANYLDEKCSEIASLRTDIEKEIAMLEDYKKSLITETVTKGLNPNVPMKNSGIDWIGSIPKDWDIHPIYYYYGERKNKNIALAEQNLLSLSYGRIIRKDINTNGGLLPASFNTYNIVEPDDIIIRPTDLQNDKKSLRTGLVTEHGIITSAYIDLMPIMNVNSKYFHYLLHIYDLMKIFYNMGNGVRQGLNYEEFSKLKVIYPSREEQEEIVKYLDEKCKEIDAIINGKKRQLETLEDYKKSLIYEYVTGKKEV